MDASDAFCEGAKIMQERIIAPPKPAERKLGVGVNTATLDDMWRDHEKTLNHTQRI